ncbi:MAG: hypothetical protein IPN42_09105 [Methylococcaceae bacterium]|nr:hypothetical protein [Methylococcaceae bacterium]
MPDDPRLIFLNNRKINPIFAIIESAWVLAGGNELTPLIKELPHFSTYSDDGETLNGAYGNRLRSFFGFDQLNVAIEALKNDCVSRRVVLTMFSPSDLKVNSLDVPCNTEIYLKIINGALDITILNRSNDLYLGLPYNVFVFGILQKYISLQLGIKIGIQRHFSDSLHLYEKNIDEANDIINFNNINNVSFVSSNFDWGYSDAILNNIQEILNNDYNAISDPCLASFLKNFNRVNRLLKSESKDFVFSNNFYGFLAYQCFSPIGYGADSNEYFEKLRRLMMASSIEYKFKQLSVSSSENIAQNIIKLANQLKGQFHVLKKTVDSNAGPLGFKSHENEELSLRILLLCLVWTTLDPLTANSSIGTIQKDEIKAAASLLDVPLSELGPLTLFENELFLALSKLLID